MVIMAAAGHGKARIQAAGGQEHIQIRTGQGSRIGQKCQIKDRLLCQGCQGKSLFRTSRYG